MNFMPLLPLIIGQAFPLFNPNRATLSFSRTDCFSPFPTLPFCGVNLQKKNRAFLQKERGKRKNITLRGKFRTLKCKVTLYIFLTP